MLVVACEQLFEVVESDPFSLQTLIQSFALLLFSPQRHHCLVILFLQLLEFLVVFGQNVVELFAL